MSMPHELQSRSASIPEGLTARLRAVRDGLLTGLIERDVAIRLALIASLAGEHLLMLGPPGTAKSLVARRLHMAFDEATYFERLLTRFTVPEELFGPLSIKGLEDDRYERLTASYLPTASIAFLDEIFKANSAILNALLTILNEREFDNGTRREATPLIAVIGASNELPEGEELGALFDRFLLRLHVGPVTKGGFRDLIRLRGHATPEIPAEARLTAADLQAVEAASSAVAVPADVEEMLCDLRAWCTAEGIEVSDRRWRKVVKLLQVSALTNGRDTVSIWDCWLLQHCLWDEPEDQQKVYDWYAARVGTSAAMDPSRLTKIVVSWEAKLRLDQNSRSQRTDAEGRPLFKSPDGTPTLETRGEVQANRDGEALFLAPANAHTRSPNHYGSNQIADRSNGSRGYTVDELDALHVIDENRGRWVEVRHWSLRDGYLANASNWHLVDVELVPLLEPTRHKAEYVDACLEDVDEIREEVQRYQAQLLAHIGSLEADIRAHLWVTDVFIEPASSSLEGTRHEVDVLFDRIAKVRQGFEMLPRDKDDTHDTDPQRLGAARAALLSTVARSGSAQARSPR